ncbi:DUF4870 domain-containing protein [Empedobacter falsenii]|uniref:DUF4870 domain-containing protein n=1 Tax=Empedobacter falsenii TaxID=343874 RepID=A0AAW7DI15_9FLAO|nr:DUF4870 domain-containing protein [Empedobacter falsenii]MDM1550290.1 DUF4870 domain-containing protein [Empedobacter falsenii]
MDNKTLSIVSYITIIGWIIAYVIGKDKADDLLKFHLKQALGLAIFTFIWGTLLRIIMYAVNIPFIGILGFASLILMIIGIINAANGVKKPLPIIGSMFEDKFAFIG